MNSLMILQALQELHMAAEIRQLGKYTVYSVLASREDVVIATVTEKEDGTLLVQPVVGGVSRFMNPSYEELVDQLKFSEELYYEEEKEGYFGL